MLCLGSRWAGFKGDPPASLGRSSRFSSASLKVRARWRWRVEAEVIPRAQLPGVLAYHGPEESRYVLRRSLSEHLTFHLSYRLPLERSHLTGKGGGGGSSPGPKVGRCVQSRRSSAGPFWRGQHFSTVKSTTQQASPDYPPRLAFVRARPHFFNIVKGRSRSKISIPKSHARQRCIAVHRG